MNAGDTAYRSATTYAQLGSPAQLGKVDGAPSNVNVGSIVARCGAEQRRERVLLIRRTSLSVFVHPSLPFPQSLFQPKTHTNDQASNNPN